MNPQYLLQRRKIIVSRLADYGFSSDGRTYMYETVLPKSRLMMKVRVTQSGDMSASVIDLDFNEPYTLHCSEVAGSFSNIVKTEYDEVLQDIVSACTEPDVFRSNQAKALIQYVRKAYGTEPEYLWERFPENAVLRRNDTGKWYGILMSISSDRLGIEPSRMVEIIDLRIQPARMDSLIDRKHFFPGWHMNKKSWYTIILDESASFEDLCARISESYELAVK